MIKKYICFTIASLIITGCEVQTKETMKLYEPGLNIVSINETPVVDETIGNELISAERPEEASITDVEASITQPALQPIEETKVLEAEITVVDPLSIDLSLIKPNEVGEIMVIMYHGLVAKKPHLDYMRTVDDFKADLQELYDNGFRIIPLNDLINNQISVGPGYTPVVLTFDDGLSTAFSLKKSGDELVPALDCAVDILNKFDETHPGFGKAATFFINGTVDTFKGDGTLEERFRYLIDNGFEIGNHTYSHKHLKTLNAEHIQAEMGKLEKIVHDYFPEYKINSTAYPYGERPEKKLWSYALKGEYNGQAYDYGVGLREGQSGASAAPNHVKYDPLNFPRVRGSNNASTDLGWQLKYYKKNPEARYISDGSPDVISVPAAAESRVDKDSLHDKKLFIYTIED